MSRITHLADEICAGSEIYFTGRQGSQYLKTAFILCDDYTELASKLFLTEHCTGWTDASGNGRFKSYPQVLDDVVSECQSAGPLVGEMKRRRVRRNEFFHSAQLLDLSLTPRMCIEAFCDLFELCELLFDTQWLEAITSARNLETLRLLFLLERHAFADPSVPARVSSIIENWPRNTSNQRGRGVHMATYPEDLHLRLCVITGGSLLRDNLQQILDDL